MSQKSYDNLRTIHFEGEVLPKWAQLLELAARLCPVPEETRKWFSRFTNASGVDDARTILDQCELLQMHIRDHKNILVADLQRKPGDNQALQIIAAWVYALDTMKQHASSKKTCSWHLEGIQDTIEEDPGDGDITLRRV